MNARDNDGDTPLHTAAIRGHKDVVELLLDCGCVPDARDNQGQTPLDEAVRRGREEIAQLLRGRRTNLAKAVPVRSDRQGRSGAPGPSSAKLVSDANAEADSLRVRKVPLSATDQTRRNVRLLVEGNSAFAIDLYRQLAGRNGNLFFSPYSLSIALGMTYAGARENTAADMAATLHFSLAQSDLHPAFARMEAMIGEIQEAGDVQLTTANALWPQQGRAFLPEYLSLVKACYGVSITPVNYVGEQARAIALRTINTWVESKTAP